MKEIPLTQGKAVLVDDNDYDVVLSFSKSWSLHRNKSCLYAIASVLIEGKCQHVLMHRLIMGAEKGVIIDHKNGNGLDNRRDNLRIASHAQNMRNSKRRVSSKWPYKGIFLDKVSSAKKSWRVRICIDGKQKKFERYATPEEAARRYDELAKQHYGEFAKLNFP